MLSNLMYLIFVRQDNNVIEQILVVGHRRCRDLKIWWIEFHKVFCHSSSLIRSFWRREMSLSDLTGRYSMQSSAKKANV